MPKPFKYASAFAGVGGFEAGFHLSDMKTTALIEWDKPKQKVLKTHFPTVPLMGDIQDVQGTELGKIDLLCGGFPCKNTSIGAPHRLGLTGKHSRHFWGLIGLLEEYQRLVSATNPRWVVIENTPGLLKSPWAHRTRHGHHHSSPGRTRVRGGLSGGGRATPWNRSTPHRPTAPTCPRGRTSWRRRRTRAASSGSHRTRRRTSSSASSPPELARTSRCWRSCARRRSRLAEVSAATGVARKRRLRNVESGRPSQRPDRVRRRPRHPTDPPGRPARRDPHPDSPGVGATDGLRGSLDRPDGIGQRSSGSPG